MFVFLNAAVCYGEGLGKDHHPSDAEDINRQDSCLRKIRAMPFIAEGFLDWTKQKCDGSKGRRSQPDCDLKKQASGMFVDG